MAREDARLLARLLTDREFRRRFVNDPAFVAREAGFPELAAELSRVDARDGRKLDARESRSSAAGVFMAAALEGLGLFDFGDAAPSSGGSLATPSAHEASLPESAVRPPADALDQTARAEQAALSQNPDDWEGNLDDEDGGADEADGSNEDEPDEGGGEDDDSATGQQADAEEGSDDEGGEDEGEGQDEIGEGSRGEDANDDESDESDAYDETHNADDSSESSNDDDSGADSSDGGGDEVPDPSAGGGSWIDNAPEEYPGDDAAPEDIAAWLGAQAEQRGLPAELPVMTALVESGMKNLDHGDADSVGLFQMRLSVWNHGDYEGYPDDPDLQLKWFLDHAEAVREQRIERGLAVDDPNQYGEWIADVQRPAEQFRGRYQLRLDDARDLLGKASAKYGGDASGDGDDGSDPDATDGTTGLADGIDGLDASPKALTALAAARSEMGTPYLWGGSSPSTGFDCSGLVQWAYAQVGVRIPRVTYDQIDVGQRIDRNHLLPGDLVFFRNSGGDVHHVGMSLGGDKFVHAPHTGDVVKVSSLEDSYYAREFTGGRRMVPAVESDDGPPAGADAKPPASAETVDPRRPEDAGAREIRRAQRAAERDAREANRPGTQLFKALERQERGKGDPAGDSAPDRADGGPPPELPADPAAEAAARHLAEVHYGFVRDSASTPDYGLLNAAGYNGILFHANDPNLGEAIAGARAAGMQSVGIWAPANLEDASTFAHRLADLDQYKPDIVVPDVEIEGKGYPGTPQWSYSDEFARIYRRLVPDQKWAVTVIPNQDDFNYGAYTSRGAEVWPQTYGATYDTTFDPKSVVDRVAANGVDPRLINPVLAPNQSGDGLHHFASYALDDFQGKFPPFRRTER